MKSQERPRGIAPRRRGPRVRGIVPPLKLAVAVVGPVPYRGALPAGPLGYVANGDGSVSIFDTDDGLVVKGEPRLKTDT